ncbi:MAG: hypothetical protein O9262_06620 [Cyclobacteriaceae bacterium]|nr:hypothetical protein [Cyclobacteriaceae bacterium]
MKNPLSIILFASLIAAMVAYYNYHTRRTQRILDGLNKEYPIISISEAIYGVVTQIDHPNSNVFRNNPHHAFILITDSIKKRIRTGFEISKRLTLDEVLKEGDLVIKESGNDFLSIYKIHGNDTLKYDFELSDDLGYPLK